MILEIDYLKYIEVEEIVNKLGGSITLVKSKGFIFFFRKSEKKAISWNRMCIIFRNIILSINIYMGSSN